MNGQVLHFWQQQTSKLISTRCQPVLDRLPEIAGACVDMLDLIHPQKRVISPCLSFLSLTGAPCWSIHKSFPKDLCLYVISMSGEMHDCPKRERVTFLRVVIECTKKSVIQSFHARL